MIKLDFEIMEFKYSGSLFDIKQNKKYGFSESSIGDSDITELFAISSKINIIKVKLFSNNQIFCLDDYVFVNEKNEYKGNIIRIYLHFGICFVCIKVDKYVQIDIPITGITIIN